MFVLNTFYKSKQWECFRNTVINERLTCDDETTCEYCGNVIVSPYDLIAHHITELTDVNVNDYNISLNPDNIMLVHFKCHNKIHQRFNGNVAKRAFIVYGSPLSGKTTWVKSVASANDLIVDMDSLYEAISINDRHIKPNSLKSIVFDMRNCLYDLIKYRSGNWQNAYIITTMPLLMDRRRLETRLHASSVFIDCDISICLERAKSRPKEYTGYINEWFNNFQSDETLL